MALTPTDLLRKAPIEAEPVSSPLGGTRAQMIQRLQVGLFGLLAMVLLVGLASIIMDNAQENQARVVPEAAPVASSDPEAPPATDPLVDAGVVPGPPAQPIQPVGPPPLQVQEGDGAVPARP